MATKRKDARPSGAGSGTRRASRRKHKGFGHWLEKDKLYGRSRYLHEHAHGGPDR